MPRVIGIDEAGYGPNLGPLVQAAAMATLPAHDLAGWDTFKDHVRRAHEPRDQRFLIDDSKKCFAGPLSDVTRTLAGWIEPHNALVQKCGVLGNFDDHLAEHWNNREQCESNSQPCPIADLGLVPMRVNIVTPTRLNAIIAETGSKAPALLRGYVALVQSCLKDQPDDETVIIADKHGGRHYYAGLMQETFPGSWVTTEKESPDESRYRVGNVTAIFRPRADATSICVSLASMMAKWLREECMEHFNVFWAKHMPGLKPTAGYPLDAKRYYAAIEPALLKLGLKKDVVWRVN